MSGDPDPRCTCARWGDLTYMSSPTHCPVHNPHVACCGGTIQPFQTFQMSVGAFPVPAVQISVEAPAGKDVVVVTIDGIRFVTECADAAQAIALAMRIARALGISWSPL